MWNQKSRCPWAGRRGRIRRACLAAAAALCLAAPAVVAQQADAEGFAGAGAALCIAAGEALAAAPDADASIAQSLLVWRQVLHAMEGTAEERNAAVQSSRAAFTADGMAHRPARMAGSLWRAGCAEREMQVRYLSVHGSAERIRNNLADLSGAALGDEAAERLNDSALCLAAAELFARERPPAAFRAALRQAAPAAPDAAALAAIQAHARAQVDAAPGSPHGRELLVDYLRSMFDGATRGASAQPMVNRVSEMLDACGKDVS